MPELREELVAALAGRYDVERELGHGGMAYVYLARDLKHGRQVAIKVLKPELAASLGPERFLREINITARLSHPNVLTLHDSGAVGDRLLYYVMPYVAGDTLQQRLDREKQLPIDEALSIVRQTAAALDYAHREGVVHRDIKPANILLLGDHVLVADFGLARMCYTAESVKLSSSAIVVGTPAYMSPEQVAGDAELDGRTDIYSLACVFFEMLAGMPPFHGATPQAVYGQHLKATPPSLCAEREHCPPEMDAAVARALSKVPADRFRTAMDFARALEAGGTGGTPSRVGAIEQRAGALARRRWIGAGSALVAVGALAIAAMRYLSAGSTVTANALDSTTYAVIPFSARSPAMDSAMITQRVTDALGEWDGVHLADDRRTTEALGRRAGGIRTLAEATRVARELGAGRVVWGEGSRDGDLVVVRAAVYDAGSGKQVRSRILQFAADERHPAAQFRSLVNALLRDGDEPVGVAGGQRPSLSAWRAYDDGRAAAARWELAKAQERFRDAMAIEPDHAQAHLWLAIVQMWDGQPAYLWRPAARRGAQLRERLTVTEAAVADAQVAQAEGRFPDACRAYARLVASDSSSVVAWYGLGECQSRDSAVVADARRPTGYRFRSSFESAIRAYRHIIDDRPPPRPAFVYRRLLDILYVEGNRYRSGRAMDGAARQFGAYPSLQGDTLAFVPYPRARLLAGSPDVRVHGKAEAIDHNRALLRNLYAAWVRSSPTSAEARGTFAAMLEMTEELTSEGSGEFSALVQNEKALRMATDSLQRLAYARAQVRLLVKTANWRAAAAFADSLFHAMPHPVGDTTVAMVGVAALTGRIRATAEILRAHPTSSIFQFTTADGTPIVLKPVIQQDILTMYAYASLGACTDSLRDLPRRLDAVIQSYVTGSRRRATRDALLGNTLAFAVPCLGPQSVAAIDDGGDNVIAMEQALARGDARAVRARFARILAARTGDRPGEIAIEYTYIESWLLAQIGDTAGAIAHLDRTLNALPTLGRYLLDRPSQSAGLVRAMGLRAELAAAGGDRATARRWATAVATLWSRADPELKPYVARMASIAAGAP